MIERVRLTKKKPKIERVQLISPPGSEVQPPPKRQRAKANKMTFTDLGLRRLSHPKAGQEVYWDHGTKGTLGLSLLISAQTKTFRSTFYMYGKPISRKLGRFPEMTIGEARELTREDRRKASKGVDPRDAGKIASTLYGDVVDQFIEQYAKPRQRTWDQTERILKVTCADWLKRPIASITKRDAYTLLEGFIVDGHGPKAGVTLRWLKTLWKWAWQRELVSGPLMEAVSIDFIKKKRTRVFIDDEIKAIWEAASKMDSIRSAYFKLLVLLAPRKSALAVMRRSELDDAENPTLWTTPNEQTKSNKRKEDRVYLTPLPPLAQRIIKGVPKRTDDRDRLFAGVPVHPGKSFGQRLIELGAPAHFTYHAMRHTVATWLQNGGHSEFEIGLVLNHSGSGGVTAGYSHGYPLDLKRKILAEWADHVAQLVQPEGAALLR